MLELVAKDLRRKRVEITRTQEMDKLGLTSVIQIRIPLLRRTQVVLEPLRIQKALRKLKREDHSQVLVLSAKDWLRRILPLSQTTPIQVMVRLGLMIVHQVETHSSREMEMLEL